MSELKWCDTRDMSADGHTKGAIDRHALMSIMHGHFRYKHVIQSSLKQIRKAASNEIAYNIAPTVISYEIVD